MTTIRAHYDGKSFVPDEPVDIPADERVILHFESSSPPGGTPQTREEIIRLFEEMERLAVVTDHPVDDSRDSIYSGTIDDPR